MALALFLLGPPRIEHDGQALVLDRHKGLALMAYLAMSGQPQRRDTLAALLWPEQHQAGARAALRRTLAALKAALGDGWLQTDRETIGLSSDRTIWCDVLEFRQLLADRATHTLEPLDYASRLYQGHFMSGFSLRDSPEFDDWQRFEAETVRQQMITLQGRLIQTAYARHDLATAMLAARRWVAIDP